MAGRRLIVAMLLILAAVLAYAFVDGGREPLREIVQPVPLPENLR